MVWRNHLRYPVILFKNCFILNIWSRLSCLRCLSWSCFHQLKFYAIFHRSTNSSVVCTASCVFLRPCDDLFTSLKIWILYDSDCYFSKCGVYDTLGQFCLLSGFDSETRLTLWSRRMVLACGTRTEDLPIISTLYETQGHLLIYPPLSSTQSSYSSRLLEISTPIQWVQSLPKACKLLTMLVMIGTKFSRYYRDFLALACATEWIRIFTWCLVARWSWARAHVFSSDVESWLRGRMNISGAGCIGMKPSYDFLLLGE